MMSHRVIQNRTNHSLLCIGVCNCSIPASLSETIEIESLVSSHNTHAPLTSTRLPPYRTSSFFLSHILSLSPLLSIPFCFSLSLSVSIYLLISLFNIPLSARPFFLHFLFPFLAITIFFFTTLSCTIFPPTRYVIFSWCIIVVSKLLFGTRR